MFVIQANNVNDAYLEGMLLLTAMGERSVSRNGDVLVLPAPLAVAYSQPKQRVLFDASRDSNPFFSLFESLWMLAGRNDAKWLDRFIHDFSTRFAEENGIQHGAYGFRWRRHFDLDWGGHAFLPDQINTVVELLKKNSNDRRALLTMWDPVSDLGANVRDVPCNTQIYLRIRDDGCEEPISQGYSQQKLDITVTCRSNDFIWGLTGANAVHFSFLHEYLAGRIGVGVGKYYQIANNAHYYVDVAAKLNIDPNAPAPPPYPGQTPIGTQWDVWDEDLRRFMLWVDRKTDKLDVLNSWFEDTAAPLLIAHGYWKAKEYDLALSVVRDVHHNISPDWRKACDEWMTRRIERMSK